MLIKVLVGAVAGGVAGYGYHVLMRCVDSKCINRKYPLFPTTVLAIAGAAAAWFWWR